MLYAAPTWCSDAKTNMKPFQVFQNKCLRLILSTSRFIRINRLHAKANMLMIDQYILELSEKFYQNNLDCNKLTKDINKINKYYLSFIPKHKLIY